MSEDKKVTNHYEVYLDFSRIPDTSVLEERRRNVDAEHYSELLIRLRDGSKYEMTFDEFEKLVRGKGQNG